MLGPEEVSLRRLSLQDLSVNSQEALFYFMVAPNIRQQEGAILILNFDSKSPGWYDEAWHSHDAGPL